MVDGVWTLLTSAPLALIWVAAALGYGWLLRLLLLQKAQGAFTLQVGLGIAALLTLDQVCGVLGVLQLGGSTGAWLIVLVGWFALALQIRQHVVARKHVKIPPWQCWLAAPSIALLLVASCSAPGVLWATEFGGFDALSYHLQLPKEWLALGSIQPLEHNVYSFLPGYVEGAYYHLAILNGDAIGAVYSCQLLHATFVILAAIALARVASRWCDSLAGSTAAVIFLGTPWIVVVGSLAYNEIAVLLMFITAVAGVYDDELLSARKGLTVGMLGAAACGAKLTSIGMVVAPLLVAILFHCPPRQWLRILIPMAIAGIVFLSPYFLRNYAYSGNPLFPFATGILGTGHWSQEQVSIWNHGHSADHAFSGRLIEFWNQYMRFGIGSDPTHGSEPWKPQWSILPWLGIAGIFVSIGMRSKHGRSTALATMLVVQCLFWIALTHLKSRFLIPAVIPMSLAFSQGISALLARWQSQVLNATLIVAAVLWSCQPAFIFKDEAGGSPAIALGAALVMSGDALPDQDRAELGRATFPAVALNYLLPADARTLALGFAAPLYVRSNLIYQTTWDRGPLSRLMRIYPDDPASWMRHLVEDGFTHLIVNESMLRRWQSAGWNDPLLTVERVQQLLQQHARRLHQFSDGSAIYAIEITGNTP